METRKEPAERWVVYRVAQLLLNFTLADVSDSRSLEAVFAHAVLKTV